MTAGLKEMGLPCCRAFFQLTVGWFTHTSMVPLMPPISAQTQPGRGGAAADGAEEEEGAGGADNGAEEEGGIGGEEQRRPERARKGRS